MTDKRGHKNQYNHYLFSAFGHVFVYITLHSLVFSGNEPWEDFFRMSESTLAGFRKNSSLHSWWESMIHPSVNNWGPFCIRDRSSQSSSFSSLLACYSNENKQVTLVGFSCKLHSSVFGTIISFCHYFDVIFYRFIYGYSRNDFWFVFVTVELGE